MQANQKNMEAEKNQPVDPSSVIAAKAVKDRLVGTQKYQKTDHALEKKLVLVLEFCCLVLE
jgi:hypothetical protein